MVGIVIGAALCYPTIQGSALQTAFETTAGAGAAAPYNLFGLPAYNTFMGIPWVGANYTSSVVPIIFIIAFAAQVQKCLNVLFRSCSNVLSTVFRLVDCLTNWFLSNWANR